MYSPPQLPHSYPPYMLTSKDVIEVGFIPSFDFSCKGTEVGDAGFSLCGGLVKTTKSLSAF